MFSATGVVSQSSKKVKPRTAGSRGQRGPVTAGGGGEGAGVSNRLGEAAVGPLSATAAAAAAAAAFPGLDGCDGGEDGFGATAAAPDPPREACSCEIFCSIGIAG